MPSTVEDLVWYAMCFIITTGLPTIIAIALNIQRLLQNVLIKQSAQEQWIRDHEKSYSAEIREIWEAINDLRVSFHESRK